LVGTADLDDVREFGGGGGGGGLGFFGGGHGEREDECIRSWVRQ
jgi:hypothetical protein